MKVCYTGGAVKDCGSYYSCLLYTSGGTHRRLHWYRLHRRWWGSCTCPASQNGWRSAPPPYCQWTWGQNLSLIHICARKPHTPAANRGTKQLRRCPHGTNRQAHRSIPSWICWLSIQFMTGTDLPTPFLPCIGRIDVYKRQVFACAASSQADFCKAASGLPWRSKPC